MGLWWHRAAGGTKRSGIGLRLLQQPTEGAPLKTMDEESRLQTTRTHPFRDTQGGTSFLLIALSKASWETSLNCNVPPWSAFLNSSLAASLPGLCCFLSELFFPYLMVPGLYSLHYILYLSGEMETAYFPYYTIQNTDPAHDTE